MGVYACYRCLWEFTGAWVCMGLYGYLAIYWCLYFVYCCLYLAMVFKLCVLVSMGGWIDGWESIDG